jgi:hypothetical protein
MDETVAMPFAQLLRRAGVPAEAKKMATFSVSSLEPKDVVLICLCYLEHATPAQLQYTSRRLHRKAGDVSTLICIFNEAGHTPDGDPPQLPEGMEILQGSLSSGVKRVSEMLFQSRLDVKPNDAPLAKAG